MASSPATMDINQQVTDALLQEGGVPVGEADRLQTLHDYNILDTPSEAAFDRITRLASRLLDIPAALVTFIDTDRQWVKASYGIEVGPVAREASFCAQVILSEHGMVVEDAASDPRFRENPQVTGDPNIRFYAGAPLSSPEGHNIGSVCVVDSRPRSLTAAQQAILQDLAAIVMDELELRRISRANRQLAVAINSLTSGVVIADPRLEDQPIVYANPGFYHTTGYTPNEVLGFNCRFLQGSGTEPEHLDEIREALAERRSFSRVIRNYRKDGTPFINELIINPVFDEAGELINFVGLQSDVTAREEAKLFLEHQVRDRTAELAESQIEILTRLARAAEYRDDDTGQHTQRVGRNASLLAEALGLPREQVELIGLVAPLHDVGKIAVPDAILLKRGKLTDEEFAIIKTHAAVGAALLANGRSEVVKVAERIAESHHERWDGRGYPKGLAGDQIPIEGRVLAVVDVFDALTHSRPYKEAWPVDEAVAEIVRNSGAQFDPRVVEAFLELPHAELVGLKRSRVSPNNGSSPSHNSLGA